MDYFSSRRVDWSAALKTNDITPTIKAHLINVYTTLALGVLIAALGSITYLKTHFGGTISFFAGFLLIMWLSMTPKQDVTKRLAIFCGFCFMEGLGIGPLIDAVIDIDPSIVTSAFLATTCIFLCFSASAFYAERRSYLYLGGFLGSALSMMVMASFMNIFFRSAFLFNFQLYFGLLVFCGFIIFDTQLIIEKAALGSKDYISDSLELFLDFINVFIRILIILAKMSGGKKKSNR